MDHAMPHCVRLRFIPAYSRQVARRFQRQIFGVDAQKPTPKQTNRALLLSNEGRNRHQAAARNFCGRREMYARRNHRPAGRRRAVLLASAGHRRSGCARYSCGRVCQRHPQQREGGRIARALAPRVADSPAPHAGLNLRTRSVSDVAKPN